MKTIKEQKAEFTLNKLIGYEEGIMTRREWIKLQIAKGSTAKGETKNRCEFNRTKYNRMNGKEQEEYEKKCSEQIPCYNLYFKDGSFIEITRAEYDYFNDMLLSMELRGEQMDLPNRIGAGIATNEEIEADMQKEFEFFNKYCR